jgi:oligopeptide/dipeptide ABC transporter ATP-binding protein
MTSPPPALTIRDLEVTYRSARTAGKAVAGVSLEVGAGEALGIVGESGCGKSTLVMAALGLLDETTADIGAAAIRADDIDLCGAQAAAGRRRALGRRIGVVFQNPLAALNPVLTIGRQLTDHMRWHLGIGRAEADARAARLLDEVGLSDPAARLRAYPHELSGGMLQRVTIAMALACEPALLVADEPTTALDATVQAEIVDLILALRRTRGLAMVWITHDLALLSRIADRIAVMYAGRIVEIGPTADLYARPAHPYTGALIASVRSLWDDDDGPFRAIPSADGAASVDDAGCAFLPRCAFADGACAVRPELAASGKDRTVACRHPRVEPPR